MKSEAAGLSQGEVEERCETDEVSLSRTKSSCVWQWGASLRSKAQGMAKRVAIPKKCCVCGTPGASGSALASPLTSNPSLVNFGKRGGRGEPWHPSSTDFSTYEAKLI